MEICNTRPLPLQVVPGDQRLYDGLDLCAEQPCSRDTAAAIGVEGN